MQRAAPTLLLCLGIVAFGAMLFGRLGHPLLWQDEAETVMFGKRVLEYGYPKVHGRRNVVYEFGPNIALGVKERSDAYIGKTWGDFYLAVPGIVWAERVDDLHAKTLRLRLPFAAAGALGMLAMLWAVLPALQGARGRTGAFSGLFLLLAATTLSLVLHLREARYYPILVLVLGIVLGLHLRRAVFDAIPFRRYAIAQASALFALFQVFYAAWFSAVLLLGAERVVASARRAEPEQRFRRCTRELIPHFASVVAVAPLLGFFETFSVATEFSRDVGIGIAGHVGNLGHISKHFLRHEMLLPAIGTRLALLAAARWAARRGRATVPSLARRASSQLALFSIGYTLLGCLNPLVYERYFVALSPVVTLIFLLDAFELVALAQRLPTRSGAPRRLWRAAALPVGLALASVALRAPEIAGRVGELREPYRGPLDFAIPFVKSLHPHPEQLVIATNYEAHPFMVYLGSHVIVGLSLNNIVAERALEPDVVIPRRRWPRSLLELRPFLARGGFVERALPVRDVHYNNVPGLSALPTTPQVHLFRTPTAGPEEHDVRLRVHHRPDLPGALAPRSATEP